MTDQVLAWPCMCLSFSQVWLGVLLCLLRTLRAMLRWCRIKALCARTCLGPLGIDGSELIILVSVRSVAYNASAPRWG